MSDAASRWKRHFSDFGGKVYLDCAAQGPFPVETVEEVRRALRLKEHPEEIPESLFEDLPRRARAAAARLIGCHPDSIALGYAASHGINIAARGLPLQAGDEVLLAHGEFPACVYPWMNRRGDGIAVRFVRPPAGRDVSAAALIDRIGPRTRVVTVSHVAWITGYRADLAALGEVCRARGIFLVVDGAQSVGAIDFRVGDVPIDILAVSGYKWLLGPYGTGFTYVNPRILDRLAVGEVSWFGVEGAARFNRPADYRLQFREGARRFDLAETASFLNLTGLAASMEFLGRVRVPTIESHVRRLLDLLAQGIGRTALRTVSSPEPRHRSSILALEGDSIEATRTLFRRLKSRGIVVSLRGNLIRVSPNIYNTPDDIEALLEAATS